MPSSQADVSILIRAKDEASEVIKSIGSSIQQEAKSIRASSDLLRTFGFGLTAIGAAGMKATSDARHLNASLAVTALTVGSSTDQLRKLAMATSNVTFPLGEVAATYDLLSRAGLRNIDVIDSVARTMDSLADAVGMGASQVADIMIPALKAYGIDLKDAGKHVDSFTWLVRNTTIDLSDFASILTYLAPDMDKLNLSIAGSVAILAVLESRGISGAAATRELRRAVTEAVSSGKSLAEVLGIDQIELDSYTTKINSATGLTEQFGDAANTQYGFIDKVGDALKKASVWAGSLLEPLDAAFTLMTFLGGASLFLSTALGAKVVGALIAATKAMWKFVASQVASLAAMGPPGWAILAASVAVAAGAIYGLSRLGGGGGGGGTIPVGGAATSPVVYAAGGMPFESFQHGGVVSGPVGAPKLAVVHGGETISAVGGAATSPVVYAGGGGGTIPVAGGAVASPVVYSPGGMPFESFQHGGVVSGPMGAPKLAVVHGGETISPHGGGSVSITLNVGNMWGNRADAEKLLDIIQRGLRSRQRHMLGEAVY